VDNEVKVSKEKPDFRTSTFSEAADWVLSELKQKV